MVLRWRDVSASPQLLSVLMISVGLAGHELGVHQVFDWDNHYAKKTRLIPLALAYRPKEARRRERPVQQNSIYYDNGGRKTDIRITT